MSSWTSSADLERSGAGGCLRGWLLGGDRVDAHALLGPALPLELHRAVNRREQREIATQADVATGFEARAHLAHEHRAGMHELTIEALHAEHLRFAVAPVTRTANTLFMS